tara:strand:+ start:1122 stop:1340 length:219 start_codon:yes stop_codon:yes gene_type:complete
MIEMVFVMMMIQNGSVIEYVPFPNGMSDCLSQKRVVSRSIGEEQEGIRIECKNLKVELENDMGRLRIVKIID